MTLRASVSRGIAPCVCPACPENSDVEGLATVVGEPSERSPGATYAALDAFECEGPIRHTLNDLTPKQIRDTLESAVEWLDGAREALADMCSDQRFDSYRDEGF